MPVLTPSDSPVCTDMTPAAKAALLLTASRLLRELNLPASTSQIIVDACGASRSRAYILKDRLESAWPTVFNRPTGRPKPPPAAGPHPMATALLAYLYDHPGAVRDAGDRRTYSDGFRQTALDLCDRYPELSLEAAANMTALPLGTLKSWRVGGATVSLDPDETTPDPPTTPDLKGVHLQTVLAQWQRWEGTFVAFCDHVQRHCLRPMGAHDDSAGPRSNGRTYSMPTARSKSR